MQGDPTNMNPRPAARACGALLPLAVALAIGVGAGAGAYALSSHGARRRRARSTVVVPAQPASSTSTIDSLTQLYNAGRAGRRRHHRRVDDERRLVQRRSRSATPGITEAVEAEGTGFEIDTKGDILTAEHVVDSATSIKVHVRRTARPRRRRSSVATSRPTRP